MSPTRPLVLLCAVLLVTVTLANSQPTGRLCGKKLIKVLMKICNHQYMTPTPYEVTHQHKTYYHRVGIVESCCYSRCSYSDLLSYCAQPPEPTTTTPPTTTTTKAPKPVKTFRSFFHLLNELRGYLEVEFSKERKE